MTEGEGFHLRVPADHLEAAMQEHRLPDLMVRAELSTDMTDPKAGLATFVTHPPQVMQALDNRGRESVTLQLAHEMVGSIIAANPPTGANVLYRSTLEAAQILLKRAGSIDPNTDQEHQ